MKVIKLDKNGAYARRLYAKVENIWDDHIVQFCCDGEDGKRGAFVSVTWEKGTEYDDRFSECLVALERMMDEQLVVYHKDHYSSSGSFQPSDVDATSIYTLQKFLQVERHRADDLLNELLTSKEGLY